MKHTEIDLSKFDQFYTYLSKDVESIRAFAFNGQYKVLREKSTQKLYINNSRPTYVEIDKTYLSNTNTKK